MDESFLRITPHLSIPLSELTFRTSRSGGPGGQNVNKLETKVEVLFDVGHSPTLSPSQKETLVSQLSGRVDSAGLLHVSVQRSRSQYQNKELALERLASLLRHALKPKVRRIPTRPTTGSKERRIRRKKLAGQKKAMRRVPLE